MFNPAQLDRQCRHFWPMHKPTTFPSLLLLKDGIDLGSPAGRLIANVLASVAVYETEVSAERIAAGKAAKAAKIEAIIKASGMPPPMNKGGRPRGIPNKVTPTVAGMILKMKAEKKKVTVIARELNLSRQTVYDVLRRA
jgi:DNA invertase Pin-like site-specific DNA recombinase